VGQVDIPDGERNMKNPIKRILKHNKKVLLLFVFLVACSPQKQTLIPSEPASLGEGATLRAEATSEDAKVMPTVLPSRIPVVTPVSTVEEIFHSVYPVMGIELYQVTPGGGVELAQQAGAFWTRRNALLWSDVEPEKGNRNWAALAELEKEMITASESGLQLILIVRSTPGWAQALTGSKCGPIAPDSLADFAAFMFDAVQRFSPPPYNVKYWELGNEPDIPYLGFDPESQFGCWGDPDNPYFGGTYYADMLKAVYPQVKAADSQAQVLVGGLLLDCDPTNPPETSAGSGQLKDCTSSNFLEGVLINDGGEYFDGVSFHAYDYYQGGLGKYSNSNWHSAWNTTGPVLIAKARYLSDLLGRYGYPDKFLIDTELALLCGRDGSEPECQAPEYEKTKASYVAQAYSSTAAQRLLGSLWYNLFGWRGSGLITASAQPLEAYDAFAASARFLEGAAFTGKVEQFPGVTGYAFDRIGERLWILWSLDGQDHPIHLDQLPAAIVDVGGNTIPVSQDITVTVMPVYITW
jgi:hypothetical protein